MIEKVTTAGYHAPKVRAFLAAIRKVPSVGRAAKSADISPGMHYRRYNVDPVYTAAFNAAWEIGVGACEDAAMENAMIGYEEPVVYQGQLQYTESRDEDGEIVLGKNGKPRMVPLTILRPNAQLHMFVLKGAKPEKYRERQQIEATVKSDVKFSGTFEDLLILYKQTIVE